MAKKDKRFVVRERIVDGSTKSKKLDSFDSYELACNYVEKLPKSRIPFCSVEDKGV
jgi:hypothetical protein